MITEEERKKWNNAGKVETAIPTTAEVSENAVLLEILSADTWAMPLPPKEEFVVKGRITSVEQGTPAL